MAMTDLQRLLEAANGNEGLREALRGVRSDAELVGVATSRGYRVTADDVEALRGSLSDAQLDRIAGGFASQHTGGVNVAFGDGSVRGVRYILPYIEQDNLT